MQKEIIQVLGEIIPLLNEADPGWTVFGSAALCLCGVPGIHVHDIDILMSRQGALRAEKFLSTYLLETDDGEGSHFRSHRSIYKVKGWEIDISGALECRQGDKWTPVGVQRVEVRQRVRYASLLDCMQLLKLFGRPKDLQRLDDLLRI